MDICLFFKNSSCCMYSALYFNEYLKILKVILLNMQSTFVQFGNLSRSLYYFWHGFLHYYPIFVLYIEKIMKVRTCAVWLASYPIPILLFCVATWNARYLRSCDKCPCDTQKTNKHNRHINKYILHKLYARNVNIKILEKFW